MTVVRLIKKMMIKYCNLYFHIFFCSFIFYSIYCENSQGISERHKMNVVLNTFTPGSRLFNFFKNITEKVSNDEIEGGKRKTEYLKTPQSQLLRFTGFHRIFLYYFNNHFNQV